MTLISKVKGAILIKNIASIKNCYGCCVCVVACPEQLISIELNRDGFYEPHLLDEKECKECGLCVMVCAYADDEVAPLEHSQPVSYAIWSKDKEVRRACSSGGVGFEIGRHLITKGYKAIGVRYNAGKKRAEHFIATTVEEFKLSIGSKYIPSYTLPGFGMLNRQDNFFITGTPCQIDSIRRYIRKQKIEDNCILVDFFCHGVPSMLLWQQYLKKVEIQTGQVNSVAWRDKSSGWHDSYKLVISGKNKTNYSSKKSDGDLFYRFFLGNLCLNEACYDHCKYKMAASAADIRIGDFWGIIYQKNEAGVSAVLALSARGESLLKELDTCHMEPHSPAVVMEGQMRHGAKKPSAYRYVKHALRRGKDLRKIALTARLMYIILNIHKITLIRIRKLWTPQKNVSA